MSIFYNVERIDDHGQPQQTRISAEEMTYEDCAVLGLSIPEERDYETINKIIVKKIVGL